MSKKIETIFNLLEICENNIRTIKSMLATQSSDISIGKPSIPSINYSPTAKFSSDAGDGQSQEGYFDGENMIGDNGQIHPVPQNYASKSQLVVGDRLKWVMTQDSFGAPREVYKLIQPVLRDRVIGRFIIDDNSYAIMVDGYPLPIKILKASATYAMKNMDLKIGDEVAVYIPKSGTPNWGAFINVVSNSNNSFKSQPANDGRRIIYSESPDTVNDNFDLNKPSYF